MKHPLKEFHYLLAWLFFWISAGIADITISSIISGLVRAISEAHGGAPGESLTGVASAGQLARLILSAIVSYLLFRFIVGATLVKKAIARADT